MKLNLPLFRFESKRLPVFPRGRRANHPDRTRCFRMCAASILDAGHTNSQQQADLIDEKNGFGSHDALRTIASSRLDSAYGGITASCSKSDRLLVSCNSDTFALF